MLSNEKNWERCRNLSCEYRYLTDKKHVHIQRSWEDYLWFQANERKLLKNSNWIGNVMEPVANPAKKMFFAGRGSSIGFTYGYSCFTPSGLWIGKGVPTPKGLNVNSHRWNRWNINSKTYGDENVLNLFIISNDTSNRAKPNGQGYNAFVGRKYNLSCSIGSSLSNMA